MTLYESHKCKWKNGCGNDICSSAEHIVFGKGTLPCEVLYVAEAPGMCIGGNSLVETAYRDKSVYPYGVPIKKLVGKTDFQVYSYDVENKKLVLGNVKKVWKTGTKKTYRVSYFWWGGKSDGTGGREKYYGMLEVTSNHKFLLKNGRYKSIDDGLSVGHRIQPFYRRTSEYGVIGVSSKDLRREFRFLMEQSLGRKLELGEEVHHKDRNKKNDSKDNLELLTNVEHARLHGIEDNPMFVEEHRETHRIVMTSVEYRTNMSKKMKAVYSDPKMLAARRAQILRTKDKMAASLRERYKEPAYYYNYLVVKRFRGGKQYTQEQIKEKFTNRFPDEPYPPDMDNHEIYEIEEIGEQDVYDMTVEKYHNFAVNGIFVHNSEDLLGVPLIGPAGKLLHRMINSACDSYGRAPATAYTNILGCIPVDEEGNKATEPRVKDVHQCRERLVEFIDIAKPRLIIAVGKLAAKHLPDHQLELPHPAFILRDDTPRRPLLIQKCIINIEDAYREYLYDLKK